MSSVNWIYCLLHCLIMIYIMYSTSPTNPGEDLILNSLLSNPFSLEI